MTDIDLWCIHLIGPDDLIAMPDRETADRQAASFAKSWTDYRNRRIAEHPDDPSNDYFPEVAAVVIPWPTDYDGWREEHATALAELRANDVDGWLK
jgi:hypothetical protein